MASKKVQFLITAAVIFWFIFIAWGMLKTSLKLSPDKWVKDKVSQGMQAVTGEKPSVVETAPQEPIPLGENLILVRAFKVAPQKFVDNLPVMGTVKGKTEIEMKFEINGVLEKFTFREGEKINKGDLIASLDPRDAELKRAYANSKYESAVAGYNSTLKKLEVHQKLFEAGAIIKSKMEEVELESESARQQMEMIKREIEMAENELKKTKLFASKMGVMGPREAEEGEFVTPQDKIGVLLETEEVFVEIGIVERDIEKVKVGAKAKVFVDAYPNTTFEGLIDNIFPVIEGKSRTLTAKIKVPNKTGSLLPGMFSRAEINIVELPQAMMVPSTSIISSEAGTLIPVIPQRTVQTDAEETQTGMIEFRPAQLGYVTSDYAQVISGVDAGDLIVIESQGELKDQIKAKIIGIEELGSDQPL